MNWLRILWSRCLGCESVKDSIPRADNKTLRIEQSYVDDAAQIGHFSFIRKSCVDKGARIGDHCIISGSHLIGDVNVGRYTSINGPNINIFSKINNIEIGSFCSIASGTQIIEYNHIVGRCSTYYMFKNFFNSASDDSLFFQGDDSKDIESKGPIHIGSDVWIGSQSVVLSGVEIGDGAVVAANSTVTRDVPPYALVGGTPAKVVGYRFEKEVIERLLGIRWWEWEDHIIRRNMPLFSGNLTLEKLDRINYQDEA